MTWLNRAEQIISRNFQLEETALRYTAFFLIWLFLSWHCQHPRIRSHDHLATLLTSSRMSVGRHWSLTSCNSANLRQAPNNTNVAIAATREPKVGVTKLKWTMGRSSGHFSTWRQIRWPRRKMHYLRQLLQILTEPSKCKFSLFPFLEVNLKRKFLTTFTRVVPYSSSLTESHHQLQIINRVRKLTVPEKPPTLQEIQYQKIEILVDISIRPWTNYLNLLPSSLTQQGLYELQL